MGDIKLLDCTLRDGGYLNDWEFGHEVLSSIFERLVSTGVDVIEVGFLDERREFDINRSIFPNTECASKIYGNMDKGNAMIVGMIDFGTCGIENIQPCSECYLDGIRVIFKEHLMYEALDFCKKIKELGYKVFAQLVSVTSYTDDKLLELIDVVNKVEPYALSMVDTYGLLHQNNLMHIFKILDKHLKSEISLGYHAHNNFQMGYANGISILNTTVDVERTVLVDGTLYGMGKSAGNAPLELLAMYLNDNFSKQYDIGQMLEAIETNIMEIQKKVQWGYNLFYYVSASTKCHPSYVSYFMNKRTLSMKSINEILLSIDDDKKLLYDQKLAEKKYLAYQKLECNDENALKKLNEKLTGKEILILGPGKSIKEELKKIEVFVQEKRPIIFAINYIPKHIGVEYVFLSNSKRYVQIKSELNENKNIEIIATSNVTKTQGLFEYEMNYSNLIDESAEFPDNSLFMLLRMLKKVGINRIALAGFDGYSESEMNYFNTNMEYSFVRNHANYLNNYALQFFKDNEKEYDFQFVTKSYYENYANGVEA